MIHQRTLKPSEVPVDPNRQITAAEIMAARRVAQNDAWQAHLRRNERPKWF